MGAAVTHSPELNSNLVVLWNEQVWISCGLAVYNHWTELYSTGLSLVDSTKLP